MSSGERTPKKRRIKKLDFENCIVTNIRTKSRMRKKLRARITREIEQIDDGQEGRREITSNSPEASPVLVKKHRGEGESSTFFTKQPECESWARTRAASPASPVFKLKVNKCTGKSQEVRKGMESAASFSQGNSSSCGEMSYQIENFTQESEESVKISSVDSAGAKSKSSGDYSVVCGSDSSKEVNISWHKDPEWLEGKESNDGNVRKNYKKNSLLRRLRELLQKQASEKLLWQHQNRRHSTSGVKLVVVDFWNDEFKFILKCRSVDAESDVTFLIVDGKWVPRVKKIREGSVLRLHPPWQKIAMERPTLTVLLNVICLDVLDEIEDTPVKNVKVEDVPAEEFETEPTLFIKSLFSFRFPELLM